MFSILLSFQRGKTKMDIAWFRVCNLTRPRQSLKIESIGEFIETGLTRSEELVLNETNVLKMPKDFSNPRFNLLSK